MKIKETVLKNYNKPKNYTYDDYLNLPEKGKRYEVINGELIMIAAPYTIHQAVSRNIFFELLKYNEEKKFGELFNAPIDVLFSENNVLQPDILFIKKDRSEIITEKNINGVPDLIIEILSTSTAYYDLVEKKEIYEKFGVKEYWIVDPKAKWVEFFENINKKFISIGRYENKDILKSNLLNGFEMSVAKSFTQES